MIQDIAPHHFMNEYCPQKPEPDSVMLCYKGRQILMKYNSQENIVFPSFQELEQYDADIYKEFVYLFSVDEKRFYLGKEEYFECLKEYETADVRVFRDGMPKHLAFAGITGYQLYRWYEGRKFCGRCGKKLQHDEKERMMFCPDCGCQEYPKIMPAVIVAVTNGSRLLMSKYANREFKKYALLAGFAEIGESIEETVRREVMEEVGLEVKNITYYKSQPWSFSDTLLLGFFAELSKETAITLDKEELALAEWFEKEDIQVEEEDLSLTNEMIIKFKNS